jgi:hypothetical protein
MGAVAVLPSGKVAGGLPGLAAPGYVRRAPQHDGPAAEACGLTTAEEGHPRVRRRRKTSNIIWKIGSNG